MKRFLTVAAVLIACMGSVSAQEAYMLTEMEVGSPDSTNICLPGEDCMAVHPGIASLINADFFHWEIIKSINGYFFTLSKGKCEIIVCLDKNEPTRVRITSQDAICEITAGKPAPSNWRKIKQLLLKEEAKDIESLMSL